MEIFYNNLITIDLYVQGRRQGGGVQPPQLIFDRSVNPISNRGADYAHHSTTSPPQIFWPCDGPDVVCKIYTIFHSRVVGGQN